MKRTQFLLLILLLTIAGAAGWAIDRFEAYGSTPEKLPYVPQVASTDVNLANLRSLARSSCECEMEGGDTEVCSADFLAESDRIRALIHGDQQAPIGASFVGTACAPVSTESTCLAFSDKEECFITGYNVNGASNRDGRQPVVCSAGDAQAIERAFVEAPNPNAGFEAVDTTLERILAGKSHDQDPGYESGCV